MEYRITVPAAAPDLQRLIKALRAEDPAAMIDLATHQGPLRVDTCLKQSEILALLNDTGFVADEGNIRQMPTTCCGGCGG